MKLVYHTLAIMWLVVILAGCKPTIKQHTALDELATYTFNLIKNGNYKEVAESWIPYEVYLNDLHPKMVPNDTMQPDVRWRSFIFFFREAGLKRALDEYAGKSNFVVKGVRPAKSIEDYGTFKVHYLIPVIIENKGNKEIIEDSYLLSAVIERDNKYQLFKMKPD